MQWPRERNKPRKTSLLVSLASVTLPLTGPAPSGRGLVDAILALAAPLRRVR